MATEIIEKNQLHLEKINKEPQEQLDMVNRLPDYKSLIKCKTGDTLTALYLPKITPSADNIIDAKNFVEEYEEYHESCSEMDDAAIAINEVMSELNDNVEIAITERQRNKKKKVGRPSYYHSKVSSLISIFAIYSDFESSPFSFLILFSYHISRVLLQLSFISGMYISNKFFLLIKLFTNNFFILFRVVETN